MLRFNVVRVSFPRTTAREQTINTGVDFPSIVRSANIALNGYDIYFLNGDHHLARLKIDCSNAPIIRGTRVDFTVNYLLRDSSGNVDDPYAGWVDILVIAEL